MTHVPVLLDEVIAALAPAKGELHVDATFGGGGYSQAVLASAPCEVIGIDRDPDAIARGRQLAETEPRFRPLEGRFGDIAKLLAAIGVETIDGVMLDIGVSSFQIDEAERGFSFMRAGPLDMRMGDEGPTAACVVNTMAEQDLAAVIRALGEDRNARRIAHAIVKARESTPFDTTTQLADTIEQALGGRRGKRTHPATQTFQALRMFVNDELGELARALESAETLLRPGGRLVVVSFHSLEDRIVKRFLRERAGMEGGGSRHRPEIQDGPPPSFELISRKAIEPGEVELASNPRARSARLRAARRTKAAPWGTPVDTGVRVPEFEGGRDAA